jgi:TPR repeat protein
LQTNNESVTREFTKAAEHFKLSAVKGDLENEVEQDGHGGESEGVAEDPSKVAEYFELAADQGNAAAQKGCGVCLWKCEGRAQDFGQGVKYVKLQPIKHLLLLNSVIEITF